MFLRSWAGLLQLHAGHPLAGSRKMMHGKLHATAGHLSPNEAGVEVVDVDAGVELDVVGFGAKLAGASVVGVFACCAAGIELSMIVVDVVAITSSASTFSSIFLVAISACLLSLLISTFFGSSMVSTVAVSGCCNFSFLSFLFSSSSTMVTLASVISTEAVCSAVSH